MTTGMPDTGAGGMGRTNQPAGAGAAASGSTAGGAHGAVDQAKEKAQQLAGQAREQAGERLETGLHRGKTRAAESLGGVAQSLLQSGQQLRDQHQGAGRYVEQAAQRMQQLSDYLQRTDVDDIIDGVESTARRQPALFLGAAFAVGLIGARFLKSSRRAQRHTALTRYEGDAFSGAGAYGRGAYAGGASGSSGAYGGTAGSYGSTGGSYGSTAGAYGGTTPGGYGDASRGRLERDVTGGQGVSSEPRSATGGAYGTTGTTGTAGTTGIGGGTGGVGAAGSAGTAGATGTTGATGSTGTRGGTSDRGTPSGMLGADLGVGGVDPDATDRY